MEDTAKRSELRPESVVPPGAQIRLRIRIDDLRTSTLLRNPTPFPVDSLPDDDLLLQVVVSSPTLQVRGSDKGSAQGRFAASNLILPRISGPARPASPSDSMEFVLRVPNSTADGDVRVSYYYHDAIVQSQRAHFVVGQTHCRLFVVTDFTTSKDFTSVSRLSDRPRVSLMVNQAGNNHTIVLRPRDESPGRSRPPSSPSNAPR